MATKPAPKPTTTFPERSVPLLSGKSVIVRPWSLKLGRLMRQRITETFDQLQAAGQTPTSFTELFALCEVQIEEIVRDTIGKDEAWMEENLAYEDLLTLAQAVFEVCLMRGGKDGILGKLIGAMGLRTTAEIAPELQARLAEARALAKDEAPQNPTPSETIAL